MRLPALAASLLISTAAYAQTGQPKLSDSPSIQAVGEATMSVKPDQAEIDIGVVTQAQTAQQAGAENARLTERVLAAIKTALGPKAAIRTTQYSIFPEYRHPRDGGKPTIVGYNARNIVEVKTQELAKVSDVIDSATKAGANNIEQLRFTLKDEQAARAEALKQATLKARANAQAIAEALGAKIVRVLHADQGGGIVRPVRDVMMARMSAEAAPQPSTPVEPGAIDIHATVTLVVEISQ